MSQKPNAKYKTQSKKNWLFQLLRDLQYLSASGGFIINTFNTRPVMGKSS